MLVPYSWLKEFIDMSLTPEEIADKLTFAGIEVEGISTISDSVSGVVTGKVLSVNPHPAADKLFICVVNTDTAVKTIITAATNVYPGAVVPVALPGAVLADGKEISSVQFKTIVSEGMLCSAQELGIGSELLSMEERSGILILPAGTPVGKNISEILALNDAVLELSLTPNRSDCLSIINVAREVAADIEAPFNANTPAFKGGNTKSSDKIKVEIANSDLCRRYIGKVVTDIKVGTSPLWLQNRLRTAGIRPINNIVDITNYVMLEYGQPMHAFDYDLLEGKKVIARNALEGEKIVTLDGLERVLAGDMLVIADAEKPVAIAGIMGGAATEVTSTTNNVLFESAYFEGSSIRKNSRKLGLRSESSLRFEKGIDIVGAEEAMNRAAQLMEELACGVPSADSVDVFPNRYEPVEIEISTGEINSLLGTELGPEIIENTFSRLQFAWSKTKDKFLVKIPPYRRDISRVVDLVEEVARLYGYNNIPTTLPTSQSSLAIKTKSQIVENMLVDMLTAYGFNEVITYSFINPAWFDKLNLPQEDSLRKVIRIQNPLNEDQAVMRTTIVPGLLETAQRNFARRNTAVDIFEIGKVFLPPLNPLAEERLTLAMFMSGQPEGDWHSKTHAYDFYDLKGALEILFEKLNIAVDYKLTSGISYCHPGRTANIFVGDTACGYMGEIHPEVAEKYDFPTRAYVCEIDIDKILTLSNLNRYYQPLPKYPSVSRDLALLVPKGIQAGEISSVIAQNGGDLLLKFTLFDVYEGEQVPDGYKSMAYSLTYQSAVKTLTDEEIFSVQNGILLALQKLGISLR